MMENTSTNKSEGTNRRLGFIPCTSCFRHTNLKRGRIGGEWGRAAAEVVGEKVWLRGVWGRGRSRTATRGVAPDWRETYFFIITLSKLIFLLLQLEFQVGFLPGEIYLSSRYAFYIYIWYIYICIIVYMYVYIYPYSYIHMVDTCTIIIVQIQHIRISCCSVRCSIAKLSNLNVYSVHSHFLLPSFQLHFILYFILENIILDWILEIWVPLLEIDSRRLSAWIKFVKKFWTQ